MRQTSQHPLCTCIIAALLGLAAQAAGAAAYAYAVTDLGTLGGSASNALAINSRGWAVGYSYVGGDTAAHATLWNGRGAIDLGTLGGTGSSAQAINDAGLIAGTSELKEDRQSRATLWRGRSATSLGALRPQDSSGAYGINNAGVVVGYNLALSARVSRATMWANGCIHDLNDITDLGGTGLTLVQANAVNERGQIAGFALNGNAETRAVLLTPTGSQPQPACRRPAP